MRPALAIALCILVSGLACGPDPERTLDLATTTSVRDSGLFEALLPVFEEQSGLAVRLVAVGSGAALRMGADGAVDVLVAHAPPGEREMVEAGLLVDRRPFMRNHFVIAGPPRDPAGIRGMDAIRALARLAGEQAPWVSRDDDSGTHRREQALLEAAGLAPEADWPGAERTGAGMAATLQVAGEKRAYVISDVGTFVRLRDHVDLVALSDPDDPHLENVYSVLRPAPERFPEDHLNVAGAKAFATFLTAPGTAERSESFGDDGRGGPLFVPLRLDDEVEP